MTSVQSRSLSPYLAILEQEISADLRASIAPEDLRAEVRKTLAIEVLRQANVALQETNNALQWKNSEVELERAETKLARHLGYVNEVLALRASQRIDVNFQLSAGQAD